MTDPHWQEDPAAELELLRQLERSANIGLYRADTLNRTMVWSRELFRIHEMDPDQGAPGVDEWIALYPAQAQAQLRYALSTGRQAQPAAWDIELPLVTASGRSLHVRVTGQAEFEDGRHIVQQGQLGTGLWVVIDGTVRVVRGSDELGHLGPGELFGEVAVFDQHPRMASVIADGDVRCLGIASWDFLDLLEHDPTLTRNVLRVMAERLRRATDAQRH